MLLVTFLCLISTCVSFSVNKYFLKALDSMWGILQKILYSMSCFFRWNNVNSTLFDQRYKVLCIFYRLKFVWWVKKSCNIVILGLRCNIYGFEQKLSKKNVQNLISRTFVGRCIGIIGFDAYSSCWPSDKWQN